VGSSGVLEFTPEQVQNPDKLVKFLEKVCCHHGNSRETQITAVIGVCWGLAHAYQATLFSTMQCSKGEVGESKLTVTVAVPAPQPALQLLQLPRLPQPAPGTVTASTPAAGTMTGPENQPVLVSVGPIQKKKYAK